MMFGVPFENAPAFPAYQPAGKGVSTGDTVGIVIDIPAKPGVLSFPEPVGSISLAP